MDAWFARFQFFVFLLACIVAWPASAGSLYKFTDPNGATAFTDVRPSSDVGVVAEIPIANTTRKVERAGMPHYTIAETDDALARASARVDVAEHNLAVARKTASSPPDGFGLDAVRMTPADRARVDFYEKGVELARRQLRDLLRERQVSPVLAAR